MRRKNFSIDMTSGSLWKSIALFTAPLRFSNFLQLLYNAADNVVVGQYAADGKTALAAVSSTSSLINFIVNLFIGLSIGTSIVVARYVGARSDKEVQETVHTSVTISVICGFVLVFVGVFAAKPLLLLMRSPEDVLDKAALYVRIYFAGMPFNMLYNFGAAVLRAVGDTRRPLYILMLSGIVNVLLNLLFVIVFRMDVDGVALATIISQAISASLVVLCLIKSHGSIRLFPKKLRIYPKRLAELARYGLPAGVQGSLFSISNVIIQSSVNGFLSTVMAGNGVASNIEGFVYTLMNTLYQASLTFTGQNVGAGNVKRVSKTMRICFLYVTVVGLIGGLGVYAFGETLIGIYNSDPEVIEWGMLRLKYVCTPYVLCGIMEVLVGSLRGMGKSVMPMIVSLLGACVLRIVWVYTVFGADPTLRTLYISYPISWAVTSFVHFCCYLVVYSKYKKSVQSALA